MKKHNVAKQWAATLVLLVVAGLAHAEFSVGEYSVVAMSGYDSAVYAELPTINGNLDPDAEGVDSDYVLAWSECYWPESFEVIGSL